MKFRGFFILLGLLLLSVGGLWIINQLSGGKDNLVQSNEPSPSVSRRASPKPTKRPPSQTRGNPTENSPSKWKIEHFSKYLEDNKRDAGSLLAAWQITGDVDLVREAAQNFPDDPQVQLAVLNLNLFPENRRKWINAFRNSSPNNSLPEFYSAKDFFDTNEPRKGLGSITPSFGTSMEAFIPESLEQMEAAFRSAGLSAEQAAAAALDNLRLPHLALIRSLVEALSQVEKRYRSEGGTQAANDVLVRGVIFSERLATGKDPPLSQQALALWAEEKFVEDANQPLRKGSSSLTNRLSQIKSRWKNIKPESQAVALQHLFESGERDITGYFDQLKDLGEKRALYLLEEQQGQH